MNSVTQDMRFCQSLLKYSQKFETIKQQSSTSLLLLMNFSTIVSKAFKENYCKENGIILTIFHLPLDKLGPLMYNLSYV